MKIGIVVSTSDPTIGGGFSFQEAILSALSTITSRHNFVILSKSENRCYVNSQGFEVIGVHASVEWNGPSKNPQQVRSNTPLVDAIKDENIDAVWFLFPGAEIVPCPMFITVWDLQHRLQPWFPEVSSTGWDWESRESHYREVLPRAAKVITGTEEGKKEVVHFYRLPPENVAVIPFPSPPVRKESNHELIYSVKAKYKLNRCFFLYPAQFWPHKNHANLLKGMAIARERDATTPDLVFTGSDKGNMAYVSKLIHDFDLKQHVHILGFIPQEELTALYQGASGLVFPTFFGPDNLPPLEAFSFGCPVIASSVAGSQEQLEDAALLFEPGDPVDIAEKMLNLHQDNNLKNELRKRGFERASKFGGSYYVETITSYFDEFENIIFCWDRNYPRLFKEGGIAASLARRGLEKIAIFGTKELALSLMRECVEGGLSVVSFLDNNPQMQGQKLESLPVNSAQWLGAVDEPLDAVIMSIEGNHDVAVREQLSEIVRHRKTQIFSWKELSLES